MSKKIIVIDDDPDVVESMRIILENEGCEVACAYSGKEGLEKIRRDKPNLIFLDVMMSTKDEGFQTAYEIRADDALKDIPIVMITAVSQATGFAFNRDKDGEFIPVDEFVEKPVKPRQLVDIVRKNLGV